MMQQSGLALPPFPESAEARIGGDQQCNAASESSMHTPGLCYATALNALLAWRPHEVEWLFTQLNSAPEGRVVAFGTGSARLLEVTDTGRPLTFVEDDPEVLSMLQARSAGRDDVEIVAHPAFDTRLPSNSAAVVFLPAHSFGRMKPSAFILTEALRGLRPGGKFLLAAENPVCESRSHEADWLPISVNGKPVHFHTATFAVAQAGRNAFETRVYLRDDATDITCVIAKALPGHEELSRLLRLTGFSVQSISGDDKGGNFQPETSEMMLLVATKANASQSIHFPGTQTRYDDVATDYDAFVAKAEYQVPEWLLRSLKPRMGKPLRILDLGCGNGKGSAQLQPS